MGDGQAYASAGARGMPGILTARPGIKMGYAISSTPGHTLRAFEFGVENRPHLATNREFDMGLPFSASMDY
jgi:hypothetical protein